MDLLSAFSDDQLAITGCFVALGLCGAVAALSFHFGPAGREQRNQQRQTVTRRLPNTEAPAPQTQERRAA